MIRIAFSGTNTGVIYLVGKPFYNKSKQRIEVEDVDFDIRTELPAASYTSEVYDSIHESNFFRVARISFQNSTDLIRDNPFVVSVRTTFALSGVVVHAADVDFSRTGLWRPLVE